MIVGEDNQLVAFFEAQFLHDVFLVGVDGIGRHGEACGNFLVFQAVGNELEHFEFTGGQMVNVPCAGRTPVKDVDQEACDL